MPRNTTIAIATLPGYKIRLFITSALPPRSTDNRATHFQGQVSVCVQATSETVSPQNRVVNLLIFRMYTRGKAGRRRSNRRFRRHEQPYDDSGSIDLLGWRRQTYTAGRTRRAERGKCAERTLLS